MKIKEKYAVFENRSETSNIRIALDSTVIVVCSTVKNVELPEKS